MITQPEPWNISVKYRHSWRAQIGFPVTQISDFWFLVIPVCEGVSRFGQWEAVFGLSEPFILVGFANKRSVLSPADRVRARPPPEEPHMGGHNTWDPGQSTNQRPLVSSWWPMRSLLCMCVFVSLLGLHLGPSWSLANIQWAGIIVCCVTARSAHTWGGKGRSWMMGAAETLDTCIPALSLSHTRAPPQATFLLLAPDTWVPHSFLNHHPHWVIKTSTTKTFPTCSDLDWD